MCDGQKPVQRRILYSMERMGLSFSGTTGARPVKCARVVGDVLGRFHPHGDQAAYDALVRMAQDFSQRYPLIDGQGNFGSRDGDGAAAMRYTEARLAPISRLLLDEIDEGTVEFIPNYDGSTSVSDPGTQRALYVITVLCLGATYLLCRWIIRSRAGRVLVAVRDSEKRVFGIGTEALP